MKNFILFITIVISLTILSSCGDDILETTPILEPTTEYPKREYNAIKSNFVFDNYNYPIQIYLPEAYITNKNLPIIYILDGKLNFEKVIKQLDSNMDAIVVGVGDFASDAQWTRRWKDLLPGNKCHGVEGKHLDFYKFITQELVPFIDLKYDNDHASRSFMGHSSAGLFTLLSLFLEDTENVMFRSFIASDPELGCDPAFFTNMLNNNNFPAGTKNFKLYLALSNNGDIQAVKEFSKDIQAKEYTWLTFKYEEFLKETHMSIIDPSFRSGLKFIFDVK